VTGSGSHRVSAAYAVACFLDPVGFLALRALVERSALTGNTPEQNAALLAEPEAKLTTVDSPARRYNLRATLDYSKEYLAASRVQVRHLTTPRHVQSGECRLYETCWLCSARPSSRRVKTPYYPVSTPGTSDLFRL
jgi:hypothetical protein